MKESVKWMLWGSECMSHSKLFDNICTMMIHQNVLVFICTKFSDIWMVQSQDIGQLVIMGHTQKLDLLSGLYLLNEKINKKTKPKPSEK